MGKFMFFILLLEFRSHQELSLPARAKQVWTYVRLQGDCSYQITSSSSKEKKIKAKLKLLI